jgi:hypothetical protein
VCRSKHVEHSINFEIVNSITKLNLVGISTESSMMHGSMNIRFIKACMSSRECPLLSGFNQNWYEWERFKQKSPKYNFTRICFAVLELLHAVRGTDVTKAAGTFFLTVR